MRKQPWRIKQNDEQILQRLSAFVSIFLLRVNLITFWMKFSRPLGQKMDIGLPFHAFIINVGIAKWMY